MDGAVQVNYELDGQVVWIKTGKGDAVRRLLPKLFVVEALSEDDGRVGLRAADGREVWATPGQLATDRHIIEAEFNDTFDEQALAEFLDTARIPAEDVPRLEPVPPIDDPRLGRITFSPTADWPDDHVVTPQGQVSVSFDGLGRDQVQALLPTAHMVLDRLPELLNRAVALLCDWEGDDSREARAEFLQGFSVQGISILHSGDFAIDLFDDQGFLDLCPDCSWPRVYFLADGTPVEVSVEGYL